MENDFVASLEIYLDYGVMGTLGVMSFLSVWIFIERLFFFKSIRLSDYKHREKFELDLSNNLAGLATIGANAPYVGLLGTVFGIMLTFYTLGDVGSVDAKKIMMGLALALKATAFGLLVAIPSMLFYTYLDRRVERTLVLFDIEQEEMQESRDEEA